MSRVNQGKYKQYRDQHSLLVQQWNQIRRQYFDSEGEFNGYFFDLLQDVDNIWNPINELILIIKEMISRGEKFEQEKVKNEFAELLRILSQTKREVVYLSQRAKNIVHTDFSPKEFEWANDTQFYREAIT